jgi:hypothetical protein
MRRTVRGCVAALVVAGVVLGAVSVAEAKPKKLSTAKYAKTMCGTYSKLENDYASYATAITGLDKTDTTGFAIQATTLTNTFLGTIKADEKTLQGVYPDISNGKKVGALLTTKATAVDTVITNALRQLQSGGAAGPAVFVAALSTLDAQTGDPFSKVTDQDLINAFQKEKSCKTVIHIIG